MTVASVLLIPVLVLAQAPTPKATLSPEGRAQLQNLKKQLSDTKRRLDLAEEKEQALLGALNEIGEELSDRQEELERTQAQIATRTAAVQEARIEIDRANKRIGQDQDYLHRRLNSIYKHGRVSMLEVLFSARSYSDLIRRTRFHSSLAKNDARRIGGLREDLAVVEQTEKDLALDLELLLELEGEARVAKQAIQMQYGLRQSLLADVRGERSLLVAAGRQIVEATEKLRSAMKEGDAEEIQALVPKQRFATQRGRLLWPATGRIKQTYGPYRHPRTGQLIHHNGVTVELSHGTEVRAVAAGNVVKSEWFKAYGNIVLIDHGEGYWTTYAHNSKLLKRKGDAVKEGEVIALSGDTASLDGAKLFFAIFLHGKFQDPGAWLVPQRLPE